MEFHIKEAIRLNKSLYLSNPDMYHWIHDETDTCNTQHDNEVNTIMPNIIIEDCNTEDPVVNVYSNPTIFIVKGDH
jgi:hypothetical protein